MNFTDCINTLQDLQQDSCPEGVEHHMFGDMVKFIKEQEDQINLQVHMKENERTKRIKVERENKELQEQVKTLQYQLKDEVAGWSPTSSAEPRMPN